MHGNSETVQLHTHNSNVDVGVEFFRNCDQIDRYNLGHYFDLTCEQRMRWFRIFSLIYVLFLVTATVLSFTVGVWGFVIAYILALLCMTLTPFFLFGPVIQFKFALTDIGILGSGVTYISAAVLIFIFAFNSTPFYYACLLLVVLQFIAYLFYITLCLQGSEQTIVKCNPRV